MWSGRGRDRLGEREGMPVSAVQQVCAESECNQRDYLTE